MCGADEVYPFTLSNVPEMTSFALVTQNELFRPDFSWTIHEISKHTRRKKFKVETSSLRPKPTGFEDFQCDAGFSVKTNGKARVWLTPKGSSKPQLFFLIRDRSSAREPQHVCARMRTPCRFPFTRRVVENKSHAHKACLTDPAYNADDSIVVDFYVEPWSTSRYALSNDGTLSWAIDNFRQREHMEGAGLIEGQESPYFYTSYPSYRVRLTFVLNGVKKNKGKGPSVKINFLNGQWHKKLSKSFHYRMALTLLNRSDPSANVERRELMKISKNKHSYLVHLCSHQQLENLIENDTLYYYVTFEDKFS